MWISVQDGPISAVALVVPSEIVMDATLRQPPQPGKFAISSNGTWTVMSTTLQEGALHELRDDDPFTARIGIGIVLWGN